MGNYDDIGIAVHGQRASASLFGNRVRDAIIDIDRRLSIQEVSQQKVLGRGSRITSKNSSGTTEVPMLRIDDIPVIADYMYRISTGSIGIDIGGSNPVTTTSGQWPIGDYVLRAQFNASPGTAATTSSASLNRSRQYVLDVSQGPIFNVQSFYYATADGYISILLSGQKQGAYASNLTFYADINNPMHLTCEFAGEDPGDTGVAL
jgi:hypothetical protein